MSNLKTQLIRLGSANPNLRADIRPVLAYLSRQEGRTVMAASESQDLFHAALEGYIAKWITLVISKAKSLGLDLRVQKRGHAQVEMKASLPEGVFTLTAGPGRSGIEVGFNTPVQVGRYPLNVDVVSGEYPLTGGESFRTVERLLAEVSKA